MSVADRDTTWSTNDHILPEISSCNAGDDLSRVSILDLNA